MPPLRRGPFRPPRTTVHDPPADAPGPYPACRSSITFRSPPLHPPPAAAPGPPCGGPCFARFARGPARGRGRVSAPARFARLIARARVPGAGRTPPACSLGAVFAPSQPEAASGQPPPPAPPKGRRRGFQARSGIISKYSEQTAIRSHA